MTLRAPSKVVGIRVAKVLGGVAVRDAFDPGEA
jgi:hypothetical protein